jgi:hypothetical protein
MKRRTQVTIEAVEDLLRQADHLSASERLWLATRLIEGVRQEIPVAKSPLKWRDVRGMLPYPACGEDAQAYISRTRSEDSQHRAIQ